MDPEAAAQPMRAAGLEPLEPYPGVEQSAKGVPLVYSYVLDPAAELYRDGEVFSDIVETAVPSSQP
ncbi:hypothetical protein [Actinacidiphila glaucinigra]|uniref:hypothetical protein n=1 Tax=Actinacidiphila glaucinigra TaxID=235986 RepID=UPI003D8BE030